MIFLEEWSAIISKVAFTGVLPEKWRSDHASRPSGSGMRTLRHRLHELTHWTGHERRLDRTWGKRFGDDAWRWGVQVFWNGVRPSSALSWAWRAKCNTPITLALAVLQQDHRRWSRRQAAGRAGSWVSPLVEVRFSVEKPEAERLAAWRKFSQWDQGSGSRRKRLSKVAWWPQLNKFLWFQVIF